MRRYFLDSSALAKNYIAEEGSRVVKDLLYDDGHGRVHVASITLVEVVAALRRRGMRTGVDAQTASEMIAAFRGELPRLCRVIDVSRAMFERAADVASVHGLRGYDAVQLAVALMLSERRRGGGLDALTFVSADRELNAAVEAEGLEVLDPAA
ncbi:hypothetical protein CMK11_10985 [Candidatus Poribacteria bacterium]|nr:hypothetical protein [Candidatus Poribacteria bacterium]